MPILAAGYSRGVPDGPRRWRSSHLFILERLAWYRHGDSWVWRAAVKSASAEPTTCGDATRADSQAQRLAQRRHRRRKRSSELEMVGTERSDTSRGGGSEGESWTAEESATTPHCAQVSANLDPTRARGWRANDPHLSPALIYFPRPTLWCVASAPTRHAVSPCNIAVRRIPGARSPRLQHHRQLQRRAARAARAHSALHRGAWWLAAA